MEMGKERVGGWCAGADGEEGGVRTAETFLGKDRLKRIALGLLRLALACRPVCKHRTAR